MSGRLSGKVAFVTGAARGQGRAHALRLAAEGADIIAVDLCAPLPSAVPYDSATPEDLDETVRLVEGTGGKIYAAVADTRDLPALRAAVDEGVARFGRLDVIVANAGICIPEPWDTITPESFQAVLDTNVTGTWNTVIAGAHRIIEGERGGSIILISSASGVSMQPFMVHYTASKHAVTGMARALAAELGKHSIRVNSVAPGPVATPMGSGDMVGALTRAAETNGLLANMNTPLLPEGIAMPEDISDAVCWLAGDESRFVTASSISVDLGSAQY
ncbi:mycofactocin-coupled SDR family oxidoreductase [Nocardia sp. NPDC051750]|uniref:mycofactocin-coupled SDR family oxidoreductase n=1 Tax=Nocardia sp. NPDC051750 TaxID=3364325 RepID=UPI0037B1DBBD